MSALNLFIAPDCPAEIESEIRTAAHLSGCFLSTVFNRLSSALDPRLVHSNYWQEPTGRREQISVHRRAKDGASGRFGHLGRCLGSVSLP